MHERPENRNQEPTMSHRHAPRPMQARSASGSRPVYTAGRETSRSAVTGPEAMVDRVLALLHDDLYLEARQLAAEAVQRFADHERVRWAWNIFEQHGRSRVGAGSPEPGRDEEFEWLSNPPEWAHGKWVALVGSEVVASADTLAEVSAALKGKSFSKRPLAHQID